MQGPSREPDRRRRALPSWLGVLLLIAVGALWHGQRAQKPFGIVDINGGGYCGLFLKHYEDFGLLGVRGMGMTPHRVFEAKDADPYLQHPPGLFWFMYLFGTEEWSIRMPTVLLAIVAAVCLFLLLRPGLGPWPALAGGALLLGAPALAVYTQASIEPMMIGSGLLLWLATVRVLETHGRRRTAWRVVQGLVAFVGPWFDWGFALFCLGLVPLVATRSLTTTLRRLALPAAAAAIAAATIIAWRAWALAAPLLEFDGAFPSMSELIRSTVLRRPPVGLFVDRALFWTRAAAGLPLALAAIPGVVVLARRAPRLAIGLLLAGTSHFLLFADHAVEHVHFFCLLCGLLAAGAASLATIGWRRAGAIVVGAVVAATWWTTWRVEQHNSTPFFQRLGAIMVDASHVGDGRRFVLTNFKMPFAYYDDTPYIYAPRCVTNPQALGGWLQSTDPNLANGIAYLWFKNLSGSSSADMLCKAPAEFDAILEASPKQRIRELEVQLAEPGIGFELSIGEVWLVTLRHR